MIKKLFTNFQENYQVATYGFLGKVLPTTTSRMQKKNFLTLKFKANSLHVSLPNRRCRIHPRQPNFSFLPVHVQRIVSGTFKANRGNFLKPSFREDGWMNNEQLSGPIGRWRAPGPETGPRTKELCLALSLSAR